MMAQVVLLVNPAQAWPLLLKWLRTLGMWVARAPEES